jgi:hypothetical protein
VLNNFVSGPKYRILSTRNSCDWSKYEPDVIAHKTNKYADGGSWATEEERKRDRREGRASERDEILILHQYTVILSNYWKNTQQKCRTGRRALKKQNIPEKERYFGLFEIVRVAPAHFWTKFPF